MVSWGGVTNEVPTFLEPCIPGYDGYTDVFRPIRLNAQILLMGRRHPWCGITHSHHVIIVQSASASAGDGSNGRGSTDAVGLSLGIVYGVTGGDSVRVVGARPLTGVFTITGGRLSVSQPDFCVVGPTTSRRTICKALCSNILRSLVSIDLLPAFFSSPRFGGTEHCLNKNLTFRDVGELNGEGGRMT